MVGAGPVVFAVWGYCIAKADTDGTLLLNPALLAPIIGTSRGEIEQAIAYLAAPDEHSKNPDHEGRRIIHQTGHLWFVVSHEHYREMKNNEDRREYMRDYMRRKREKESVNINEVNTKLTKVNPASASSSVSSSDLTSEGGCKGDEGRPAKKAYGEFNGVKLTDAEHAKLTSKQGADRLAAGIAILDDYMRSKGKRYKDHYATLKETSWVWQRVDEQIGNNKTPATPPSDPDFDRFLQAWPIGARKAELDARRAFAEATTKPPIDELIAEIELQKRSEEWTKDDGKYIPTPANWLRGGRWTDMVSVPRRR